MATSVSGYEAFLADRYQRLQNARDEAHRAHFQAEIDLVLSWGVTSGSYGTPDPADIADPPATAGGGTSGVTTGDFSAGAKRDIGTDIDKYRIKLPPGMPAVFDLPVGGTGKTLRQIVEEAAQQTGTPAIIIAAQMWQETKAGLWGKDAAFVATYGKPGQGAGSGDTLDQYVTTVTANPGNGLGDSGILQINPDTYRALVNGEGMGGGVTLPAHPELAGFDTTNIEHATLIAATLMKDYFNYYSAQSYSNTEADAWNYALRAYVGGPGSVIPGNPYGRAAGGGDITYVDKVHDHMADFIAGVPPRWPA